MNKKTTRKLITIKDPEILNYLNIKKEKYGVSNTDLINFALKEQFDKEKTTIDFNNEKHRVEIKSKPIMVNPYIIRIKSITDRSPLEINVSRRDLMGNRSTRIHLYKYKTDEYISTVKNSKHLRETLINEFKKSILLSEPENIFSLIIFKKVTVNIYSYDINKNDSLNDDETLTYNIKIHWDRFFIDTKTEDNLFFDFLNIKYLRYGDFFEPFKIHNHSFFNEFLCLVKTQYGIYYCPICKSPLDPIAVDEKIKRDCKDNMLVKLSSDNILVSTEGLKKF